MTTVQARAAGPRLPLVAGLALGALVGLLVVFAVHMAVRHGTADLEAHARALVPDSDQATFVRVESVPLPNLGESSSVQATVPGAPQDVMASVEARAAAAGWAEQDREVSPGGTTVAFRRDRLEAFLMVPDQDRLDADATLTVHVAEERPVLGPLGVLIILLGTAAGAGAALIPGRRTP